MRSHPAQHGETFDWSANLRAKRFRAPEDGYILPFSRRVSVPCEGNRKGRKAYCGLVKMWSSPCRRDGEVEKSALRAVTSPLPEEEGLGEKVETSLERGTG